MTTFRSIRYISLPGESPTPSPLFRPGIKASHLLYFNTTFSSSLPLQNMDLHEYRLRINAFVPGLLRIMCLIDYSKAEQPTAVYEMIREEFDRIASSMRMSLKRNHVHSDHFKSYCRYISFYLCQRSRELHDPILESITENFHSLMRSL